MAFLDGSNSESWASCSSVHRQLDVVSRQALMGPPRWFPEPFWPFHWAQMVLQVPAITFHCCEVLNTEQKVLLQSVCAGGVVVLPVVCVGLGFDLAYPSG